MENINVSESQATKINDEAWAWIVKFEGDVPPKPEELKALHTWMAQSPDHHQTLKRLSRHWQSMDALQALTVPAPRRNFLGHYITWLLSILFAPLILLATLAQQAVVSAGAHPRRFTAFASVLVLALGVFSWQHMQTREQGMYVTAIGEQSREVLLDGSVLRLNTNSQVRVDYRDNKRRLTLLQGEAFFDVRPDPERPFEVFAGTRMVRAVGTAFTVYLAEEQVEVTVSEGKVAVGTLAKPPALGSAALNGAELFPAHEIMGSLVVGQSVVIPAGPGADMKAVTEHEKTDLKRRLAWLEGQLIYAGENLETVVKEVSRYTPVYIELADADIKGLRIGGQFKVGEVEALFGVLEVGFGLKVIRISENHVQITR
ncbi:FecR domain-containing protein [Porticoccaceae bacterium]|nr:FecR domain-containing protein [Porticoccaceae bacterium]